MTEVAFSALTLVRHQEKHRVCKRLSNEGCSYLPEARCKSVAHGLGFVETRAVPSNSSNVSTRLQIGVE